MTISPFKIEHKMKTLSPIMIHKVWGRETAMGMEVDRAVGQAGADLNQQLLFLIFNLTFNQRTEVEII